MAKTPSLHPWLTKYARRSWKETYIDFSLSPQGCTMEKATQRRESLGHSKGKRRP